MPLSRRALLQAFVPFALAGQVRAEHWCGSPKGYLWGYQDCDAWVDLERGLAAGQTQEKTLTCWAAAIATVFRYHGYPVSQSTIIRAHHGWDVNMRGGPYSTLSRTVNGTRWRDSQGRQFVARTEGIFDYYAGRGELSNSDVVAQLQYNRPLIVGTRSHAMVIFRMEYLYNRYLDSIRPKVVHVWDPWPGVGFRALRREEMTAGADLLYVAAVRIVH
ncbi:MAG: papain-like cysteine protease family protein [Thermoanaerobaculia bacterium]|nr:papain-like cysteine protease family protein [Thermoanaerobaculia bacterium]